LQNTQNGYQRNETSSFVSYLLLFLDRGTKLVQNPDQWQGRHHGFESGGGGNFARSARKFFLPPTFWPVGGGQNIA